MDSTDQRTCDYYKNTGWLLRFLFEVFVLALIVWSWYVCVFVMGIDVLKDYPRSTTVFLLLYHIFASLMVTSLLRTTFSDPGSVPRNFRDFAILYERDRNNGPRFCGICNHYKPDRAKHCSDCNTCVLKMDHHCPWVNNCVGFRNYKFFCLFILYTAITCIYLTLSTVIVIFKIITIRNMSGSRIQVAILAFISLAFGLTLIIFAIAHLRLIRMNITTIESLVDRIEVTNIYDLGWKKNIQQVFGKDLLKALLPVRSSIGDGLRWECNRRAPSMHINLDEHERAESRIELEQPLNEEIESIEETDRLVR